MNHIVLFEPEIPQNTGNIMRTCVATNTKLHLIRPLGFNLDEKHIKRSAANYLEHLDYQVYDNLETFFTLNKGEYFFFTRYGEQSPDAMNFDQQTHDVYLFFGSESKGLPVNILKDNLDHCIRLPMTGFVRSLNLSNAAAIVIYEVLRQQKYQQLFTHEPNHFKGKDYLKK